MKLLKPTLILATLLSLATFGALLPSVKANLFFAMPPWEDGSGTPGNRTDGVGRGDSDGACSIPESAELQALIPEEKRFDESNPPNSLPGNVLGTTASETPALWFSLNQSLPDTTLTVTLETEAHYNDSANAEKPITSVRENLTAGVFSVPLPSGSLADINTNYHWKAVVESNCIPTEGSRPGIRITKGWIMRVEVPDEVTIAQDPQALATAYAESGIWFDTLSTLAEMYRSNPSDPWVTAAWNSLMEAADLDVPVTDLAEPEPNASVR